MMIDNSKIPCVLAVLGAAWMMAANPPDSMTAELTRPTVEAYSRYVQATEARVKMEMSRPKEFLYVDGLQSSRRAEIEQQLKNGDIFMDRLETLDPSHHDISIPGGLVHHWIGDVFVPGITIRQAVELAQDYAHHQDIYRPEL